MSATSGRIPHRVHLIGIGGAGMSGLARSLVGLGHQVSGSDRARTAETERLSMLGAELFYDHRAEHIANADLVVVSDAIPAHNAELMEARERAIPILRRAECLDLICAGKTSICVAGSHGKSTTSAMIAKVLDSAALSPSFVIGERVPSLGDERAAVGSGAHIVVEACEAFQNLACFHPNIAVITNIDDEHLEHYGSQAALDRAFEDFANRPGPNAIVVAHGDDASVRRILPRIRAKVTTFGLDPANTISARYTPTDSGVRLEVVIDGAAGPAIEIPLPGRHIAVDALACVAACRALGLSFEAIANGLSGFTGVARRWQDHGEVNGIRIVDDYAHHPAELRAIIETARSSLGVQRRLVIAFQPQLFSRTRRLHQDFAAALSECDHVLLLDVDPGGEQNTVDVSSKLIANAIIKRGGSVELVGDIDGLVDCAPRCLARGDFLLVAGAGSIRTAAPRLLARLRAGYSAPAMFAIPPQDDAPRKGPIVASLRTKLQALLDRPRLPVSERDTVVSTFRECARLRPASIAVSHGDRRLSFMALNELSDALVPALKASGIAHGDVVGIRLAPSIELIAVMLAALKMGAVYLPIDATLPDERAKYMLTTSGARALVVASDTQIAADSCAVIPISSLQGKLVRQPRDAAGHSRLEDATGPAPDDAAYVCFTSGSTGYPKGVAISHRSLAGLIADITQRFRITPKTRTVLNTSISFDVSLAEIWMTLGGGGELCITGSAKPLVGSKLADFIEDHKVTHLAVTPSVLASVKTVRMPALKCIIAAGEACPQELVNVWARRRAFFNVYGPTEATVYATAARCRLGKPVTIGTALAHINTYVLDQDLNDVPPGEPGELCLGGIGVAKEYIARPQESADRFRSLIRNGKSLDQIYRTGDVVKRGTDGELIFLGRLDNQIKIRGNRIEIEEIEQTLARLPDIGDTAIGVSESNSSKELIAFCVTQPGQAIDATALSAALAAWLPDYMIPSHFVRVDEIPLTSSGKKDRRALTSRHGRKIARRVSYAEPRTEIEATLARIWKDVLELDADVGVNDDFAALGGDSLKSLLLIEEIERRFRVATSPGYFGRFTTIYRLAIQVSELLWHRDEKPARGETGFRASRIYKQLRDLTADWAGARVDSGGLIVSVGKAAPAYELFICIQYRDELRSLAKHMGKDFRIHGMRSGHLVMNYSNDNVSQLSAYYADEIARIAPTGRILVGGICQGGTIAFAVADLLQSRGMKVSPLILIEQSTLRPFDGQIEFIYSEESFLNPQKRFSSDFSRYEAQYGARYRVDTIPGEHGTACMEPNVQFLANRIRKSVEDFGTAKPRDKGDGR